MSGEHGDMTNGGRFSKKVALVTGAGSGIGRAVATTLATEGAHVHLVGRTKSKLEATAGEFPQGAAAPGIWPLDLNIDASLEQLRSSLLAQVQNLDVLVLAAGELVQGTIAEMPVDVFDRLWASNVRSVYVLVQKLLPLVTACQGQIVFVNSSAGLGARPNGGQYAATKHALKALADALRAEVNAQGVRVLSIYPGRTATPRMERLYADGGQAYRPEVLLQATDVAATVADALSLPRTAEVTDLSIRPLAKSY
ncbi:MAG: SDR family NAD(P)-dependent oxidoreductase [Polyangia bacterium]